MKPRRPAAKPTSARPGALARGPERIRFTARGPPSIASGRSPSARAYRGPSTTSASQGEWPTHPELLDWLAVEFMDSGLGCQASHATARHLRRPTARIRRCLRRGMKERDPYNRLLRPPGPLPPRCRGWSATTPWPSRACWSSEVGGRERQALPAGRLLGCSLNFPTRTWYVVRRGRGAISPGACTPTGRRSFLHPSLQAFDAPSREECTADRSRAPTSPSRPSSC